MSASSAPSWPALAVLSNISQNAKELIFVGTFTAGGLKIAVEKGQLRLLQEGKSSKFIQEVEQRTFSGSYAASKKQRVLYVIECCVFCLTTEGLELIEIAPGIDLEQDILAQKAKRRHAGVWRNYSVSYRLRWRFRYIQKPPPNHRSRYSKH
jgi:hypothetical protein